MCRNLHIDSSRQPRYSCRENICEPSWRFIDTPAIVKDQEIGQDKNRQGKINETEFVPGKSLFSLSLIMLVVSVARSTRTGATRSSRESVSTHSRIQTAIIKPRSSPILSRGAIRLSVRFTWRGGPDRLAGAAAMLGFQLQPTAASRWTYGDLPGTYGELSRAELTVQPPIHR